MTNSGKAIDYVRANHDRYLAELKEFFAIPSISTLSEHQGDVRRAAEWVAAQLRSIGMQKVEVMSTEGHPVVYGEWLGAPGKPTVMVYGHYDV
ncbi:MAG: peptidase M20, partial [Anaerolineae bacterium]